MNYASRPAWYSGADRDIPRRALQLGYLQLWGNADQLVTYRVLRCSVYSSFFLHVSQSSRESWPMEQPVRRWLHVVCVEENNDGTNVLNPSLERRNFSLKFRRNSLIHKKNARFIIFSQRRNAAAKLTSGRRALYPHSKQTSIVPSTL
jgi:hypothetical protein